MINREERAKALMEFDMQYRLPGIVVAGMDEAGRGPLAGNVVAACVVMPEEPLIQWVDDSKKLSAIRRGKVFEEIMTHAVYVGIGEVSPEEIDRINILQATKKAMRTAAETIPAHAFLIAAAKTGPRPESVLSAESAGMIRDALGWENGSASYLRLFDIKIVDESGEKVEIAADLSVHHPGLG